MTVPKKSGDTASVLSAAVLKLLAPLVRLLLRYGVPYAAFADLAKRVYVDEAERLEIPGRKRTVSRAAVLTGLSRKEVARVRALEAPDDRAIRERYSRAARVIAGWLRDESFRDARGRPRAVALEGESPSFAELVKRYSGDMPARAVLDELERVGAVETEASGKIRLVTRAYVPASGEADKLEILGTDVADLIATIAHNLACAPGEAFFQRKVAYDNLADDRDASLRRIAGEKAQALLEDLDRVMASRDRDVVPGIADARRKRAMLGIYYFEEDIPEKTR